MTSPRTPREQFDQDLAHIWSTYRFCIKSLPAVDEVKASGRVELHGFSFANASQVESMVIELGWAFFLRMESCLEAFMARSKSDISAGLEALLNDQKLLKYFGEDELNAIRQFRELRNILHHGATATGMLAS